MGENLRFYCYIIPPRKYLSSVQCYGDAKFKVNGYWLSYLLASLRIVKFCLVGADTSFPLITIQTINKFCFANNYFSITKQRFSCTQRDYCIGMVEMALSDFSPRNLPLFVHTRREAIYDFSPKFYGNFF